jgi:hypothetical protein
MRACSGSRHALLPHARHEERIVAAARDRTHLVQLGGLEPPTSWSTAKRSNQLSYSCPHPRRGRNLGGLFRFDKVLHRACLPSSPRTRGPIVTGLWNMGSRLRGDDGAAVRTAHHWRLRKSPGGEPGLLLLEPSGGGCDGQATFLNTLPKLSLTGSADSTATFCAIEASSLD